MYAISTAACVSILSLVSALGGVQAQLLNPSIPRPQCTDQYDNPEGKTCDLIASHFGLNITEFQAMNTDVSCNATLTVKSVCVGAIFRTCSHYEGAMTTNCDKMAALWGISVAAIVAYNSNVDDKCDNLVLENSYCVAIQPT